MKPKRCEKLWPFSGPIPSGERMRCTLEVGHTGPHTIIPPSGMDYAPDDTAQFPPDRAPETTTTDLLSVEQLVAVGTQRQGPCEATTGGGNWFTFRPSTLATQILVLRDEKMALLLIVDDCHRIMGERADRIDQLQNANRDLHIRLHDLEMEKDEEIHALKVRVTDTEYGWHDLALAAKEYMAAEGAGGTFDAGRVRETRARLKELMEDPE